MDPQHSGAAVARREEAREPDGKFGIQQHAAPVTVIAGGVVSEYVDPRKGSFQYPDRLGFNGTAEDHVSFFMKVPIPESLVQAADRAYEQRRLKEIEYAGNRAAAAVADDPAAAEYIANAVRQNQPGSGGLFKKLAGEAREKAEREEAARWPGKSISPTEVRTVLRAAQAYYLRSMIKDPEQKRLVEQHRVQFVDGTPTLKQVWEGFRCREWLQDAL